MTIGAAGSTREGGQHEEPMGIVPSPLEAGPAACRRMRILHVSPYYHPSVGGLQLHVKALSDHLAARGHDVTVFTSSLAGSASHHVDDRLRPLERIGAVTVRRFRPFPAIPASLLTVPGGYRSMRRLFGAHYYRMLHDGPWLPQAVVAAVRLNPDVVLVASAEHEALFLQFSRLQSLGSIRLVALPLLHLEHEWSRSPLVARYLSRFHAVIANTEHERAFIEATCAPQPLCRAVGVGVDPEPFQHRNGRAIRERYGLGDDTIVGYVARLQPEKGVIRLIEAMRVVWQKKPGVRLLLAGHRFKTGSDTDQTLQATLDSLASADRARVTLIEGFSDADKASIFDACDVFALPSIAESFGIVYLEAWLCEKPVIGARIGAVQCVIEDGKDGFLVDPHGAGELSEAILRLIDDPDLRRQFGQRGREKTLARFTWSKVTDAVEAIYAEAIAGRNPRPRR
jgi:glycosyltransferase involved in cell wall biosynthesis